MKTKIFILTVLAVVVAACTKQKSQSATNQSATTTISQEVDSTMALDSMSMVEAVQDAEPEPRTPSQAKPQYQTSSSAYSTSSTYSNDYYYEDDDEDEDFYDNLRKHSPNDNYLLGFDEDVDDIHDMEIYMEDY